MDNLSRTLTGRKRSRKADMHLGVTLAFIAGAINAGGFLAIGQYTSHMTGIVSAIADYIVLNKISAVLQCFSFLLSFIAGAASSAMIINWARARQFYSEFASALMLEGVLLLIFGVCATNLLLYPYGSTIIILLLCFIMGLQNAIITKISNSEIRTTHVTGISTDIGIEIGRALFFKASKRQNPNPRTDKLALRLALIVAFLTGGITGGYCFSYFGFITTVPLAIILAVLAAMPILDDIKTR